jgi:hypothetical protein
VQEITVDGDVVFSSSVVVDSFEDGDMSEYNVTGGFTVVDESNKPFSAKDGSKMLEVATNTVSANSTSGLNDYPQAGDTFRCWHRFGSVSGTGNQWTKWGVQSESDAADGYYVNTTGQGFSLRIRDGGNNSTLASGSVSFQSDEWYELEVDWATDGTFTVSWHEEDGSQIGDIVTATNSEYASGGIGFRNGAGADTVHRDFWRITREA